MKVKINFRCLLCDEVESISIEIPGWSSYYKTLDPEEPLLCPKHAKAMEFFKTICSNCVSAPNECRLYRDIEDGLITDKDLKTLEQGKCPRFVCSTLFVVNLPGKFKIEDTCENKIAKSGKVIANAIRDFYKKRNWGIKYS